MVHSLRRSLTGIIVSCLLLGTVAVNGEDSPGPTRLGPKQKPYQQSMQNGISFLKITQSDDGSWTTPKAIGITALCVTSLLEAGVSTEDESVQKALKFLEAHVRSDGGIYAENSLHRNYETCISLMALKLANQKGKYNKVLKNAEKFLRGLQWDKGEGLEDTDTAFGGAGYGKHQRPDLSNTQFLIEALRAAGVKKDDPAIQNALKFVSRTQNLETEHNTTPHAAKVNDGGFYYTPAAGGQSQAGTTDNGGLRSYGSMTYAGLKSMIYAGLTTEDPRVKAATQWIQKNYTLTENPGLGQQGLYYYFHTFAKANATMKLDLLEDDKGTKHDWRAELASRLFELQKENGSWSNQAERWYEGDPNLSTAYALMALKYCEPKKIKKQDK